MIDKEAIKKEIELDMALSRYAEAYEWMKWDKEIPFIEWPQGWKVKARPPFRNAIIRYKVIVPNSPEEVSIYLDCYDKIGCYGAPYWEVYPYQGDVGRCDMHDTDQLLKMIADRSTDKDRSPAG